MKTVVTIVTEFWQVLGEMAPYLLFGFFMAVITNDSMAQAQLHGDMTINELQHVGMRMAVIPGECS